MESTSLAHNSEDFLVQQAIKRDRAAFTALYESCIDRVYRHVYYKVSNHYDAEEITQEAFVRAWKAIDKYKRTGAPFVSWIITIAGNLVIDYYREHQKVMITDEIEKISEKDLGNQIPGPERQAEMNFDNGVIKKAVLKLNGDKQKVILMHFIDGLSYEEIAQVLNKSEGAIRVIQYRALSDLRGMVKRN
jgi:RNA polymerase sigma-70 factor (ECF subfamily)